MVEKVKRDCSPCRKANFHASRFFELNLCNECTGNWKTRLKCCLSCTEISEMLISPSQLNTAQIQNRSARKGAWLRMWGSASALITKHASDTRPSLRTAAKVFIYMKRLSTYIIGIITSERILKKEITSKDTSYNFFWFQKSLSPSPNKVWFHLLPRARWCVRIKRRDLFTYIVLLIWYLPAFKRERVDTLWSPHLHF